MMSLKRYFPIAALLVCGGCYTYRSATIESLPEGAAVRARLSAAGAEDVEELTGSSSRTVSGMFVRSGPDTVVMAVWRTDLGVTRAFEPGLLQVPVARPHIEVLDQKRLSYPRTAALVAGLGVVTYQVYRLLWDGAGGTSPTDPGGGPSLSRCCE